MKRADIVCNGKVLKTIYKMNKAGFKYEKDIITEKLKLEKEGYKDLQVMKYED